MIPVSSDAVADKPTFSRNLHSPLVSSLMISFSLARRSVLLFARLERRLLPCATERFMVFLYLFFSLFYRSYSEIFHGHRACRQKKKKNFRGGSAHIPRSKTPERSIARSRTAKRSRSVDPFSSLASFLQAPLPQKKIKLKAHKNPSRKKIFFSKNTLSKKRASSRLEKAGSEKNASALSASARCVAA